MIPTSNSAASATAHPPENLFNQKEKVQALSIQQLKIKRVFKYILENLKDQRIFSEVKTQLNGKIQNFDTIQDNLCQRSFYDIIYLIVEIYNVTLFKDHPNKKKRPREEDGEPEASPTKRPATESKNGHKENDSTKIPSTPNKKKRARENDKEELSPSKRSNTKDLPDQDFLSDAEPSSPNKKNNHHFTIQTEYKLDDSVFKVILATHNNHIKPRLKLNAQQRGAKGLEDKTNSEQIYFFYRNKPEEIFAVTSGSSHKIVRAMVNYKFPKKALCLLNSEKIIEIAQKSLIQPYTETVLRNPSGCEFYTTQRLFQFVDHFTCQIKTRASIMELPFFQAPSSLPYLTIKQSLLRVERDLDIKFYPQLLNALSLVSQDKTKESTDPLFEFLSIPQVTRENGFVQKMLTNIYNYAQNNEKQIIYFQPSYGISKEFLYADSYTIEIGSSKKTIYGCPTLEVIVRLIFELKKPLTSKEFIQAFERGYLNFNSHKLPFLECLNGEISHLGRSYFKVENKWYYLKADHHALLQEDFKKFLSKSLMSDSESKQLLPYSWAGNTAQNLINVKSVQEHLNLETKEAVELISVLKNAKVSYLQFFKVNYKKLQGDILQSKLNDHFIKNHIEIINRLLAQEHPTSETDWQRELGANTEIILSELEKKRTIVDTNLNIINSLPEPVKDHPFLKDCYDKFQEFIIKNHGRKIKRKDLIKHLGKTDGEGIKSFLEALKTTYFSFIQRSKVHRSILQGEILKDQIIRQHQQAIEKLLSNGEFPDRQQFEKTFGTKVAAKIIKQLSLKRSIVNTKNQVVNPSISDTKDLKIDLDALQKFLEKACEHSQKSESEEEYNRSYLQKNFNEETQLFNLNPLRIILDQVCPQGVELADKIFHDPKIDPSKTYLCVIKEEFGQDTRVACSQAVTAAKMLKSALSLHQENSYLEQIWERGINPSNSKSDDKSFRELLKMQLQQLGKAQFLQLFNKKIVFVYAFLKKGKSLTKDKKNATRVEIKDFDSLGEDSVKIYDTLKRHGFLDSLGRLSGKFYGSSAVKFESELSEIKECKISEVYAILLKFKSISKSTLAKLELLKAAREIESLGFEFKICEIEKKIGNVESLDDSASETPELDFSSNSNESSSPDSLSSKTFPYLIHGKKYKICSTKGDGGCGLHALLGIPQNNTFTCDIARYRKEFGERLKDKLLSQELKNLLNTTNQDPNANNPLLLLWDAYKKNFQALLENSIQLEIRDPNAKALFKSCETIKSDWEEYLKHVQEKQDKIKEKRDHRLNLFEKHFERLYPKDKELKSPSKTLKILMGSKQLYESDTANEFKDKMYGDKTLLRNAFEATLDTVTDSLDLFTKPSITNCTTQIKKLELEREKLLQDFILLPNVIEHYCSVVSNNSYYLAENELVLAAFVFDKHLWIITRESYPKEREPYQFAYNNNGQRPIVIYHEDVHYERCIPIDSIGSSSTSSTDESTQLHKSASSGTQVE